MKIPNHKRALQATSKLRSGLKVLTHDLLEVRKLRACRSYLLQRRIGKRIHLTNSFLKRGSGWSACEDQSFNHTERRFLLKCCCERYLLPERSSPRLREGGVEPDINERRRQAIDKGRVVGAAAKSVQKQRVLIRTSDFPLESITFLESNRYASLLANPLPRIKRRRAGDAYRNPSANCLQPVSSISSYSGTAPEPESEGSADRDAKPERDQFISVLFSHRRLPPRSSLA